MLPKAHALFGVVFSLILYFIFNIGLTNSLIVFLSSILIDVDHYLHYLISKRDSNLKNAFYWNKKLPLRHKPIMHILHSVEFLVILAIFSFFFPILTFILLGFIFHSILDLIDMAAHKEIGGREFFLSRYILSDKSKYL